MPPKTGSSEPKVDDEAAASKEERKKLEVGFSFFSVSGPSFSSSTF